MTSAMPVQCSNQLSYEVTQLRAGQFVGRYTVELEISRCSTSKQCVKVRGARAARLFFIIQPIGS